MIAPEEARLPEPLTPQECDLRDFAYMPLDVVRLRDSDIAATPDAEIFRVAVLAWSASWHQVPAASLPDDDAAICRLVGMGRDVKGFRKLREAGETFGFIKCSDGRLYHPVVAEKAVAAWEAKKSQRNRTQKARDALQSQRAENDVTEFVTVSKVSKGKGSEGKEREPELSLGAEPAPQVEPEFIRLPTNLYARDEEEVVVTIKFVQEFQKLYPATNVEDELRKMRAWLLAHSESRKTKKGMKKFINSWLQRQHDRGGVSRGTVGNGHPPADNFQNCDDDEWKGRIAAFRNKSIWSPNWGPKPGEPGCRVPPHIHH